MNTDLLQRIRERADVLDQTSAWPAEDLADLAAIGAMNWVSELTPLELHLRYEQIAAASLSTALALSQRDSAVGLIEDAESRALAAELLPGLLANKMWSTVGIAQLTTSSRGGPMAVPADDGFLLNGTIPWATGADQCEFIVAGSAVGTTPPSQILVILPMNLPGVTVERLPLVALGSTHTVAVRCENVKLASRWILTGPTDRALAGRRKSLAIGQSFMAMGLCLGALNLIADHNSERARVTHKRLADQLGLLRGRVLKFCDPDLAPDPKDAPRLRGACNDLAVRITHAAVALYKGTALLAGHPAQRLAREAMFLLVWSCPDPVIECTVALLSDAG